MGFIRILTMDGRAAIVARAGPLFEAMQSVIRRDNPSLADEQISRGLRELLGPFEFEHIFDEPRSIHFLPCYVEVAGRWVAILESDPQVIMQVATCMNAYRTALKQELGDVDRLRHLREGFISKGGHGADFDNYLFARFSAQMNAYVEQARANNVNSENRG